MLEHMVSTEQLMFFVSVSCVFVSICKKKICFYTNSTLFTVFSLVSSLFFRDAFCQVSLTDEIC